MRAVSSLSHIAASRLPLRTLLTWLLLAFVPFTGVRMVCIDRPPTPAASAPAGVVSL